MKLWADNESKQDLIGFRHLADAVIAVVNSEGLLPGTIGVFGDWGSGKSTLLGMVAESLNADAETLVLQFNGWLFEGYDDAKAALMETIIEQVVAKQKLAPKAKKIALKLIRRVNWFRVAGKAIKYGAAFATGGPIGTGLLAGIDAAEIVKKAGETLEKVQDDEVDKLLNGESAGALLRGVREFRAQFGELLTESSIKRLVVIIDDLDRCLPSTIIETLEAIKLFLFVEHSAFILGADERLVKYAVRQRFPELPGENAEVGRDYLEKLIQFPVRVPPLARGEMTNYICHLFASSCDVEEAKLKVIRERALGDASTHLGQAFDFVKAVSDLGGFPQTLLEQLALAQRIGPILGTGLNGNPRQCKRFLNTLVLRLKMADSRKVLVEPRTLAKLMLLEYFKPASFRRLAELQVQEDGKPAQLEAVEAMRMNGATGHVAGEAVAAPAPNVTRGSDDTTDEDLPQEPAPTGTPIELAAWLEDPWVREWLGMEPALGGVDLRPYFYFSRDILSTVASTAQRLTPKAQEILEQMLQASDAIRKLGARSAKDLSDADAAAVFEELASRTRREDNFNSDRSTLTRLIEWVDARRELAGQLILTLGQLPEALLPISVVPSIQRICAGTPAEPAAKRLLNRWKDQAGNPNLRQAATRLLARPTRGGRP